MAKSPWAAIAVVLLVKSPRAAIAHLHTWRTGGGLWQEGSGQCLHLVGKTSLHCSCQERRRRKGGRNSEERNITEMEVYSRTH